MYSEKLKTMSRPLVAILMLALVFVMAPLLPMTSSSVDAAGETVLTVINNNKVTEFDADMLDSDLDQESGVYSWRAASGSGRSTSSTELSGTGPTLESILLSTGLDLDSLAPATIFTIIGKDNKEVKLNWSQLSSTRYYFEDEFDDGTEVPTIINSPSADEDAMRLLIGMYSWSDRNQGFMLENVNTIIVESSVLTISHNTGSHVEFGVSDLRALKQYSTVFSSVNSAGTKTSYFASGASLESILNSAGIDSRCFTNDMVISFIAIDNYKTTITWENLVKDRFYFFNGNKANQVPVILNSPDASENEMRLFIGQIADNDQNNAWFNQRVCEINIGITPTAITLNANGGKTNTNIINRIIGEKHNLPNPTKVGYEFKGWYTAAKGGSKITSTTTVTNKDHHTIYAQWTGIDNNLKSLKITKGKLSKKFKAATTSYTLKLKKNQKSTKITAAKAQAESKVQIKVGNGKFKDISKATVKVAKGKSKTIKIKVTAENGSSKTYTVKVKRAK